MRAFAGIVLVVLAVGAAKLLFPGADSTIAGSDIAAYEIRPGQGIGPVQIGMSRDEARRAMQATGQTVDTIDRGDPRQALVMQGNGFQAYFDASDRVHAVEVMRPYLDMHSIAGRPPFAARLGDVDVFRTPATHLVRIVSRVAPTDPHGEDPGVTFEFPTIGLDLWREGIEDTPYFETVYVSRPRR